jgi:hypothetical protein
MSSHSSSSSDIIARLRAPGGSWEHFRGGDGSSRMNFPKPIPLQMSMMMMMINKSHEQPPKPQQVDPDISTQSDKNLDASCRSPISAVSPPLSKDRRVSRRKSWYFIGTEDNSPSTVSHSSRNQSPRISRGDALAHDATDTQDECGVQQDECGVQARDVVEDIENLNINSSSSSSKVVVSSDESDDDACMIVQVCFHPMFPMDFSNA